MVSSTSEKIKLIVNLCLSRRMKQACNEKAASSFGLQISEVIMMDTREQRSTSTKERTILSKVMASFLCGRKGHRLVYFYVRGQISWLTFQRFLQMKP